MASLATKRSCLDPKMNFLSFASSCFKKQFLFAIARIKFCSQYLWLAAALRIQISQVQCDYSNSFSTFIYLQYIDNDFSFLHFSVVSHEVSIAVGLRSGYIPQLFAVIHRCQVPGVCNRGKAHHLPTSVV